MRDRRFIAEHRGGLLKREFHEELAGWACECVVHVASLLGEIPDIRFTEALLTARKWIAGDVSTGEAMKASVAVHTAARECRDMVKTAVYRAAGHAVATAHMADHSLGGAIYAVKAVMAAGGDASAERDGRKNKSLRN